MTTQTVGVARTDKARIAASALCVLLVLAGVYGPFLVRWPVYPYEFDSGAAVRCVLALAGLIGLVVLSAHNGYTVTTLVLTGIAGVVSLYETGPTADRSALDSGHQNPAADIGTQGLPVSSGDSSGDIGRFVTLQKRRNPGKSLIFRGLWSG